jgi:hypothetical protein
MILEYFIIIVLWIIGILAYYFFISPKKVLLFHVAFLFNQVLTWSFGLLVAENKLIAYPKGNFQLQALLVFLLSSF